MWFKESVTGAPSRTELSVVGPPEIKSSKMKSPYDPFKQILAVKVLTLANVKFVQREFICQN